MRKEIKEIVCGSALSVLLASVITAICIIATITYIKNADDFRKYMGYPISNDSIVDIDYSYVQSEEDGVFTDITVYAILSDDELNDPYFTDSVNNEAPNETNIDDAYILSRGCVEIHIIPKLHGFLPEYMVYWYRVNYGSQYNAVFHATLSFKAFISKNIVS